MSQRDPAGERRGQVPRTVRGPLRLRLRADFARLRAQGTRRSGRHVWVSWLPRDHGVVQFAAVAGRNVGGAVQRNKAKRRLREILRRRLADALVAGDLAVFARPSAVTARFAELQEDVARLLHACGLTPGEAGPKAGDARGAAP